MQIPGTYRDAMNSKTQLGGAIKSACEEIEALGRLEQETLSQAEDLLRQVGFKGSLFDIPDNVESSE